MREAHKLQLGSAMNSLRSIASISALFVFACSSGSAPPKDASNAPPTRTEAASAKGSADAPPPAEAQKEESPSPAPAAEAHEATVALCDVVCERAFVEPASDLDGSEDLTRAVEDANRVLDGLKPDLLACFERIRTKPQSDAFMTVSIVVGKDGKVQSTETKGGAPFGERASKCVAERAKKASFAPPRGHGTMRVEVPFTLRKSGEAP